MANQLNMTISIIAKKGQSVTVIGPTGQQVTVSGPGGKFTITFTTSAVNVIPEEDETLPEVVEEPEPEVEEPVEFRQWPNAEPGALFHRIDTIANAGKVVSKQFSNLELEDLASLKVMNTNTFNLIFDRMGLSTKAARNVLNRIKRILNPELAREDNRRSLERYHRMRRQNGFA
jgi:hypothetical protein